MIETRTTRRANQINVRRALVQGQRDGQLGIGGILGGRVALYLATGGREARYGLLGQ